MQYTIVRDAGPGFLFTVSYRFELVTAVSHSIAMLSVSRNLNLDQRLAWLDRGKYYEEPNGPQTDSSKMSPVTEYLHDFCCNTSLHGFRYLVKENSRTVLERLCWLVALVTSIAICSLLILDVKAKWDSSPVMVSFEPSSPPINSIPFPAVTICSETKVSDEYLKYVKLYKEIMIGNATEEGKTHYQYLQLVCDDYNEKHSIGSSTVVREEAIAFIEDVAPKFDDIFLDCKWINIEVPCDTLFSKVITDEGVCFTFNGLNKQHLFSDLIVNKLEAVEDLRWNLKDGYSSDASYPRRTNTAGPKAGLSLQLFYRNEEYQHLCTMPIRGFKMIFHNPLSFPRVGTRFVRIPMENALMVGIVPLLDKASEGLLPYVPERRNCFFHGEKYLRFFRVYTKDNCEVECLTNLTYEMCGCSSFYQPATEDTPMCGAGSNNCVKEVFDTLYRETSLLNACNCLPACFDIKYDASLSQSTVNTLSLVKGTMLETLMNGSMDGMTQAFIYFKDTYFTTVVRTEVFGLTDFLANCGGLLGLFMGFSFLSLVETVYYFSLRILSICCLKYNNIRPEQKKGGLPEHKFDRSIQRKNVSEHVKMKSIW